MKLYIYKKLVILLLIEKSETKTSNNLIIMCVWLLIFRLLTALDLHVGSYRIHFSEEGGQRQNCLVHV